MKKILLLLSVFCLPLWKVWSFQAIDEPSSENCAYYGLLEQKLACGHHAYLQRWAYPMCEKYIKAAPGLSYELQVWFPQIRLCLQEALYFHEDLVNCKNLNDFAVDSHVFCYVKTGFCEMSSEDQWQLLRITGTNILQPLWLKTALRIDQACAQLR